MADSDRWSRLLDFPNPVNENAARVVAGGVAALALLTLVSGWWWLTLVLAGGFAARTLSGPRFSLLGRLATGIIAPRLGPPRYVPGPPKRFAQGIGLVLTTAAALAWLGVGATGFTAVLTSLLLVFATLESALGFCAGCWLFGLLVKTGVVPDQTCAECANIWARYGDPARG